MTDTTVLTTSDTPTATTPTLIPIAREKLVTTFRQLSDRNKRELKVELEGLAAQGYKIACIRHRGAQCDVSLVKHDSWTVDEVMDEMFTPQPAGSFATGR